MSSSSIRIISSSSTTRIRLAGGADCNGVADVILYPPMDTPVTPCCATDAWDVAHAAYSPLKTIRLFEDSAGVETIVQSQAQFRPAAATMPAGRQGEVEARHFKTDGLIDGGRPAAQVRFKASWPGCLTRWGRVGSAS